MTLQQPTPTPTLDAVNIEPWITTLVERLGNHWPWLRRATPGQIRFLAEILAAVLNRAVAHNSLHVEIERDPAVIEAAVEKILQTMKPERVQ